MENPNRRRALARPVRHAIFAHEAFSFWTHFAGALAALAGVFLLVSRAEGALAVAALSVYGVTLVAMFGTSALHHVAHRDDGLFRRLDMTAIFLFIAGTYTPVCLLAVPATWGVPMAAVVWALAIAGIALRWMRPVTPRWVTAGLYLGLGWISLAGIYPLWLATGGEAIALLGAGGLAYTVGAVVYALRWPDPWPRHVGYHGLWHVFVLVGAAFHFALVWRHVPYL
jgi:hemolysin III